MRRQGGHSQMHMAEVVLKNLKKIYPNTEKKKKKGEPEKKNDLQITDEGVVAVQDFNLHIADKEFIVLVGPSGCGKSTLLRAIAGLNDVDEGSVFIDGKDVTNVDVRQRQVGMLQNRIASETLDYVANFNVGAHGFSSFSCLCSFLPLDSFITAAQMTVMINT